MRRHCKTPDLLAQALRERMAHDPIEKITVKSITDACGVNRQTFYYHFDDICGLIRWMYMQDVRKALQESFACEDWTDSLLSFLMTIKEDAACHRMLYEADIYYTEFRNDFHEMILEALMPLFVQKMPLMETLDADYREFLTRVFVLVLFEFVEKRARGIAFSSEEQFVRNWTRCLEEHRLGIQRYQRQDV